MDNLQIGEEQVREFLSQPAPKLRGRSRRLVGFPLAFLTDVCRLTEGRATLVVAMLIFRRTCVLGSRTVTLPGAELAEVGINRDRKSKALAKLEAAGVVRIEKTGPGQTAEVTLQWRVDRLVGETGTVSWT